MAAIMLTMLIRAAAGADLLLPQLRIYDTGSGLSQGSVLDIVQDAAGYIWLATQDGLNRFDGYNFEVVRPGLQDNNTQQFYKALALSGHTLYAGSWGGGLWSVDVQTFHYSYLGLRNLEIRDLTVDSTGRLWIATYGQGVFLLQPDGGFQQFFLPETAEVNVLLAHPEGGLFAGTDEGLFRYDEASSTFVVCLCVSDRTTQPERVTSALAAHRDRQIWIAFQKGLMLYDFADNTILAEYSSDTHPELGDDNILSLYDDGEFLWIGTSIGGLYRLTLNNNSILHYTNQQSQPLSSIHSIVQDYEGNFLLGANGSFGIHTPIEPFWNALVNDPEDASSLPVNQLWQLLQDKAGDLWMGSASGGLIRFEAASGRYRVYRNNPADPASLANNEVFSIMEDDEGRIWCGTNAGLSILDPVSGTFKTYVNDPEDNRSLSANSVWCVFKDSRQRIWVGTRTRGLNLYNPATDDFTRYAANPGTPGALQSNFIYTMFEDSTGSLWVGTIGGGLHRMGEDLSFKNYRSNPAVSTSLPNDFVLFIDEYTPGQLWITTNGGGIALFDSASGEFSVYQERDGLPNNVVYAMLPDDAGRYWLSTNNGISVFYPDTATFRNFNMSDGLPWLEFNGKSYVRTAEGLLYFGSTNGLLQIDPERLVKNLYQPLVRLQQLRVNYEPVAVEIALKEGLLGSYFNQLVLRPEHRHFSVGFSSSSYAAPLKNQYRYMLRGFDSEWIYPDDRRAGYTNLPAGTFRLEVQGSNNDGIWSVQSAVLELQVIPVWYENRLYQVLFAAFVLVATGLLIYTRIRALKLKNIGLIKVISNLAHELNSPLGAMNSSTAMMEADLDALLAPEQLRRMFRLDNTEQRLTDSVKLEAELRGVFDTRSDLEPVQKQELSGLLAMYGFRLGEYQAWLQQQSAGQLAKAASAAGILSALAIHNEALRKADNVITTLKIFTRTVSDTAFETIDLSAQLILAAQRLEGKLGSLVELQVDVQDGLQLSGLKHQLELVWDALLSNAMDASLERQNSRIVLRAAGEGNVITVIISDNGPPIPFFRRHKIFRPFYTTKAEGAGRGLGLSVSRLIIQVHQGSISFTTSPALTTFTVHLPLNAEGAAHE